MSRRILEYKLLEFNYASSVESRVNRHLEEGWELYGHPAMGRSNHTTTIVQAMVRYESPQQQAERFGFRISDGSELDEEENPHYFNEDNFRV